MEEKIDYEISGDELQQKATAIINFTCVWIASFSVIMLLHYSYFSCQWTSCTRIWLRRHVPTTLCQQRNSVMDEGDVLEDRVGNQYGIRK